MGVNKKGGGHPRTLTALATTLQCDEGACTKKDRTRVTEGLGV